MPSDHLCQGYLRGKAFSRDEEDILGKKADSFDGTKRTDRRGRPKSVTPCSEPGLFCGHADIYYGITLATLGAPQQRRCQLSLHSLAGVVTP